MKFTDYKIIVNKPPTDADGVYCVRCGATLQHDIPIDPVTDQPEYNFAAVRDHECPEDEPKEPDVPKTVYLWQNDMVMTFGEDGEQIVQLQGRVSEDLVKRIVDAAEPDLTEFQIGTWGTGYVRVVKMDEWEEEARYRVERALLDEDDPIASEGT